MFRILFVIKMFVNTDQIFSIFANILWTNRVAFK